MSNNLDNLKINYYSSNNISLIAIKENLSEVEDFKKFKREYILKIIDFLIIRKYILETYSYSGWGIFNRPIVVNRMKEYIRLDTINCKKKLALMLQLTNSKDFPYEPELFKRICDLLKIRLIR